MPFMLPDCIIVKVKVLGYSSRHISVAGETPPGFFSTEGGVFHLSRVVWGGAVWGVFLPVRGFFTPPIIVP